MGEDRKSPFIVMGLCLYFGFLLHKFVMEAFFMNTNFSKRLKRHTTVAVLCAMAFLCTVIIKFPVMFLTMDIKDSIIMLCTLFFGVPSGIIAAVIVPLLEYMTISGTGEYGLIMNVISSVSLCVPVGLIYKYKKTLNGAILGLCVSVVTMTAIMMIANLFITPFYMGVSRSEVVALIPTLLLPFNLVKGTLNAAVVLLLYKPLSRALKKNRLIEISVSENTEAQTKNRTRSLVVTLVALAVIAISLMVIFVILGGNISFLDGVLNK